jgi:hypothetical protein
MVTLNIFALIEYFLGSSGEWIVDYFRFIGFLEIKVTYGRIYDLFPPAC